ncbi:SPOR domain-containing protein [Cohnella sp. LGH]|uniref:SPOR domain-containing protein n=1 Tax=Cohnella sp. LGH TaxID=1619153 RepID=UPI001ADCDB9E|nr:SPOR domain-containing protein [Cohnella sp. LGH]QTH44084.1 SPOR domain-containing protein [Cohnella sp. LGH]
MPSNARMTIRFEPQAKPKPKTSELPAVVQTEPKTKSSGLPAALQPEPIEIKPISQETAPAAPPSFEAWKGAYPDDIHALEEIIRKSDSPRQPLLAEKAFSTDPKRKKARDDLEDITVLEWLERERENITDKPAEGYGDGKTSGADNGWYDSITTTEIVRERGPSWGRVVLSVTGAIATGVLFGYVALGLFTGDSLFPKQPEAAPAALPAQSSAAVSAPVASAEKGGATATEGTSGAVSAKSVSEAGASRYYLLQFGVFRSQESMETAAGQLKDKGYSWGTDASDGYRVYAAAALTKEEAELLAAQMTGLDVYIKPIEGAALEVGSGALTGDGAEFIDAGAAMIRELVRVSGAGLQERQPSALSDKRLAEWQAAQERWKKAASHAEALGSGASEETAAMTQALKAGEAAMAEYLREPSRKQLWNMQTAAMSALLADHRLRAILR